MKLCAYRCRRCGATDHPKLLVCAACGGRAFDEVPLEGMVTLLTYTRVYNLPEGIDKPYLDFGIVEFENGVRVTGQLEVRGEARIGMKLKAETGVVRLLPDGPREGFIFKEP